MITESSFTDLKPAKASRAEKEKREGQISNFCSEEKKKTDALEHFSNE